MSDICERLRNMAEDYFKFKIDELPSDSLTRQVSESYIADIESAIAEIERLRSGWISVEDRLPEESDAEYICYCHAFIDNTELVTSLIFSNGKWGDEIGSADWTPLVSHWMPLPQPPQEPK